jgi:hypothetical protein
LADQAGREHLAPLYTVQALPYRLLLVVLQHRQVGEAKQFLAQFLRGAGPRWRCGVQVHFQVPIFAGG